MLDIAAFSCGEKRNVTEINRSVATVAVAMAEAVATVEATCSGSGSKATVRGTASARAQAEADGHATAKLIGNASVCKLCDGTLQAVTEIMETVSVTAVASAKIDVRLHKLV